MATKNLARTIIEGGRARYNKFERGHSHRTERVLTRAYLAKAGSVDDGFEALSIGKRPKVYKGFSDKLGAPRRWLRSQVNRPWDEVRSEMVERFNPKSLQGQHISVEELQKDPHDWTDVRWFPQNPDLAGGTPGTPPDQPPACAGPGWRRG